MKIKRETVNYMDNGYDRWGVVAQTVNGCWIEHNRQDLTEMQARKLASEVRQRGTISLGYWQAQPGEVLYRD